MLIGLTDVAATATSISRLNLSLLSPDDSGLTDGSPARATRFSITTGSGDALLRPQHDDPFACHLVGLVNTTLPPATTIYASTVGVSQGFKVHSGSTAVGPDGKVHGWVSIATPHSDAITELYVGVLGGQLSDGFEFELGELVAFGCADVKVQTTLGIAARGGPDVQLAESGRPSVNHTPVARILNVETIPIPAFSDWEQLRGTLARMPWTAVCLDPSSAASANKSGMMAVASNLGEIRTYGAARHYSMRLGFTEIVSIF